MTPLLGFLPDGDATAPGVITECVNFIPYANGMEGAPSAITPASTPALAATCLGAAVVSNLAGVRRVYAGTATKIYELSGGAWVDRAGSAYLAGIDTRWSFAQFGDATIAANRADTMQRSTGAAFADISGAPKADIVFSVGPQLMALNVNDGAEKPDGWHCCAVYDDTDWTEAAATQSASGRLVSSAGPITAGARLGEYAVAYKARSMYLGRYVGAPAVWEWLQISSGEVGCVGKEALCDIGGAHLFVGDDNVFVFDGTRPVPIADGAVRQWLNDNCNPGYRYRIKCVFDRTTNRVSIFFPSSNSSTCDEELVYHVPSKKWGRATRGVEALVNFVSPGLTFDTWSSSGSTFDTLQAIPYDSAYWLSGGAALSAFNTSHQLQLLVGESTSSSFTTGDTGDDHTVTLLQQIRLRYAPGRAPDTASVDTLYKMGSGDEYASAMSGALMADGKFDALKAARWHRARFLFTGAVRVLAIGAKYRQQGPR